LRAQSSAALPATAGARVYARIAPEHCQIVAGGMEPGHDA
jgi:hypothetical protein